MWQSAARKVTEAEKMLESMKRMYETLAEEPTQIYTVRTPGGQPRQDQ